MRLLDDAAEAIAQLNAAAPEGLRFEKVLGAGKSAVVFLAYDAEDQARAVKVYDADLLEKYGREVQVARLQREIGLTGHSCPSLVQVYGGGSLELFGRNHYYVSLEYVGGTDLRERVESPKRAEDVEIRAHLTGLFEAANYLDQQKLCHRDIKVDNCRLRATGDLVLLDLGVLRPTGASDLTDDQHDPKARYFLGTLRYAPPEYLLRKELDTRDGWRAVSIYQIGTVLYELLHGTQLFSHVREPYGELVHAVLHAVPVVMRDGVGQDLVRLTKNCLLKDPAERLKLVAWDSLGKIAKEVPKLERAPSIDLAELLRVAAQGYEPVEAKRREEAEKNRKRQETRALAKRCVEEGLQLPALAELGINLHPCRSQTRDFWVLEIKENIQFGFPSPLWLCCGLRLAADAVEVVEISGAAFYGDVPDTVGRRIGKNDSLQRLVNLLDLSEVQRFYSTICNEPPSESVVVAGVREWASAVLARYLEATQELLSRRRAEELEKVGKSFFMSTRQARFVGLGINLCEQVTFRPRR